MEAFHDFIDDLRKLLRKRGEDPLGDKPTEDLSKKTLDKLLAAGEPEAAGVGAGGDRRFCPRACGGDPPLSKAEGLAPYRTHRRWRRLPR
jgi:hypothetical protein